MCVDMCVDMRVDMRADMCMDMRIDMREVYSRQKAQPCVQACRVYPGAANIVMAFIVMTCVAGCGKYSYGLHGYGIRTRVWRCDPSVR